MTIIYFLIIFAIIVAFHEFGHLYFAKRAGVLVREFAIGMGPKIFATRKNGTTYTIRAIPFGGYVRLATKGEDDDTIQPGRQVAIVLDEQQVVTTISLATKKPLLNSIPFEVTESDLADDLFIAGRQLGQDELVHYAISPTATIIEEDGTEVLIAPSAVQFQNASIKNRLLINVAGPVNNFILGIIVLTLFAFLRGGVPVERAVIGEAVTGYPAQVAGVQAGDTITAIDGQPVTSFEEISTLVSPKPNTTIQLSITRADGSAVTLPVTTTAQDVDGQTVGLIGVSQQVDTSIGAKFLFGLQETWRLATEIFTLLGSLFTQGFNINAFGGPVSIAATTNTVAQQGLIPLVYFLGFLSVNLGIMNLLPIPGLDGGKILLNFVELLRGKPLNPKYETAITIAGVILLLVLMVAVTWNDILRHFVNR